MTRPVVKDVCLLILWVLPGITVYAFDPTVYPLPTPELVSAIGSEAPIVIRQFRKDPTLDLRYYAQRSFSDAGTGGQILQGTITVVIPVNEHLGIPLMRDWSGSSSRFQRYTSTGLIYNDRLFSLGAFAGGDYRGVSGSERAGLWIVPVVYENRLTRHIVGYLAVETESDTRISNSPTYFADIRFNDVTYRGYSYDNLGFFYFTGQYNRFVTSEVYGLRLGSTLLSTEIGYRSFSGAVHRGTYDDSFFFAARLELDSLGLQVTMDRYTMLRVSAILRNVFGTGGLLAIDIGEGLLPLEAYPVVTIGYTVGIDNDWSVFPPMLRRRVYRGGYYNEIVLEDDFEF